METFNPSPFLIFWNNAMMGGAALMAVAGILYYIYHKVKLASIHSYKGKYDFINEKEIKHYKATFIFFALGAMMLVNLYGMNTLDKVEIWFFVRLFISLAGGTLVGYVAYLVLDYYYPTIVHRKLSKWRYKPRVNSATGNTMRLLSEEEEDVHLEEGMQAEENIFSIDYDVWVDEQSGDVQIEKYPGHLQALKCNSCGFYTMRVVREEITQQPAAGAPGELIKHFQCSYCKSVRATAYKISTKAPEDYKATALKPSFRKNKNVDLVRIEIHSNVSGKKFFEFQNMEQATRFLEEYEDKG